MTEPVLGEIRAVAFSSAPVGWASCDGQLLLISDYPDLFAILGSRYGGDGISFFALPDLRGRTVACAADPTQAGVVLNVTGALQQPFLTLNFIICLSGPVPQPA